MKTPEEIKRGLEHCAEIGCKDCPYEEDCNLFDEFSIPAEDAYFYIQQLEQRVPRWISVKERLPEKSGDFMCWVPRHEVMDVIHYSAKYKVFNAYDDTYDPGCVIAVTHWMPLPEPPEEAPHEASRP